jgi:hypothetical protein
MCWSGEASAALAVAGLSATAYSYKRGEPKVLCAALGYFSCMEVLQAYTYSVIDQCGLPQNQIATMLGYLHIAFQPFFINAASMHFIPEKARLKIQYWVYALCLFGACMFIIRMYPFEWLPLCYDVDFTNPITGKPHLAAFCGKTLCSVSGKWHIAWQMPVRYHFSLDAAYFFVGFLLPVLYGSWRVTLYHTLTGPLLSYLTTDNSNEWIAVWCLYSIGLLAIMVKSPLRKLLYVKNVWYIPKT